MSAGTKFINDMRNWPIIVVPSGTNASKVVTTTIVGNSISMPEYAAALAVLSMSCSNASHSAFRNMPIQRAMRITSQSISFAVIPAILPAVSLSGTTTVRCQMKAERNRSGFLNPRPPWELLYWGFTSFRIVNLHTPNSR